MRLYFIKVTEITDAVYILLSTVVLNNNVGLALKKNGHHTLVQIDIHPQTNCIVQLGALQSDNDTF
jgi:hypothetical protein